MNNNNYLKLIELDKKATPAPWEFRGEDFISDKSGALIGHKKDRELIVVMRNALPGMLAEIEEIKGAVFAAYEAGIQSQKTVDEINAELIAGLYKKNHALRERLMQIEILMSKISSSGMMLSGDQFRMTKIEELANVEE